MQQNVENRVIAAISQFRGRLADEWVKEYVSLAEHNECGLALENLCDQLFEFDIVPTQKEFDEIVTLAKIMGLERKSIYLLRSKI